MMDPDLGIHLLADACPSANKAPLNLEDTALEGLVRQGLSLFSHVYLSLYMRTLVMCR